MMKRLIEIWKKWFGKSSECVSHTSAFSQEGKAGKRKSTLLDDLEAYLFTRYDFRFNVLTEQTEYRQKGEGAYAQVEQRVLNTLCIDARGQGINCWDKDVSRLLHSQKIKDFHPFLDYMAGLPEWDV